MKIRILSNTEEISGLSPTDEVVHCAFRPKYRDVSAILDACPKIKALQVPRSYMDMLAESVILLLKMNRVVLIEGNVQGHRKDIDNYYEVPQKVNNVMTALKASGKTDEYILEEVRRMYVLTPDTAKYVLGQLKIE